MSLDKALSTVYTEQPSELHTAITKGMIEALAERVDRSKIRTILDVGCGMGVAWPFFDKEFSGPDIHVITPDETERYSAMAAGCLLIAGTVSGIQHDWGGKYDLIWARHSLEHTIYPYSDLLKLRQLLADDGLMYVEVPAPGTICNHEFNPNHYSVFGSRMWLALFDKTGFEVADHGELKINLEIGEDTYYWFLIKGKAASL
jgi:SAM-dependent methyltransferase